MYDSLDAALEQAKRPERVVYLCLRGDLQSELEDIDHRIESLPVVDALGGDPERTELEDRRAAVLEEMRDARFPFRIVGVTRPEWRALLSEHEPREDNTADRALGYNGDTFPEALIRTCLSPKPTEVQWMKVVGVLSEGQFNELFNAAVAVSLRKVEIPKSRSASAGNRNSAAT
jgi:hypothetical protein